MLTYLADARDGATGDGCQTCCCQEGVVRPGETNKVTINYANWVAPLGGRGLIPGTTFAIEKQPTIISGGNLPPSNIDHAAVSTINQTLLGTVATPAVDPEAQPLTYALVPLYGPRNGTVTLLPAGTYTYTPTLGFVGYDEFVFSTSDGINAPVLNRARITVNALAPTPVLPAPVVLPVLNIPQGSIKMTRHSLSFALAAGPELKVGDMYKLTVQQPANDCDQIFWHTSCYDILVGKC